MPKKLQVGIYLENVTDIQKSLIESREAGFDFICSGLLSKKYCENELSGIGNNPEEPFCWFDMSLSSSDWSTSVVGVLSDLQEDTESPEMNIRNRACGLIERELGYVQHLSMYSTMVNLQPGDSTNLGRLLYSKITIDGGSHSNLVLWVHMPMVYNDQKAICGSVCPPSDEGGNGDANNIYSSWNTWNQFRTIGNADRRVYPVLDLPVDLPDEEVVQRWLGEPVKAVCLFITNQKGFPVLSKRTQRIVKDFFDIGSQIIVNCKPDKSPEYYIHYKQYIEFIYGHVQSDWEDDPVRKYTKGYEDYLQSPLQPLMDNLEANTYEVFERDPTKYQLYQDAVAEALKFRIPEEEKDTKTLVVMVVGAGRGPLVRNCLAAAELVKRKIKLYAVEKNINAVCTLLHLKKHVWGDQVTVISCDMREWETKEKADIMVSELLGSFGDNELSPECLDGAQKFLKESGIMIPESYTSYIAPIMSPKLHADVRPFFDINKHTLSNYETPYVVYLKTYYEIDRPKPLFVYCHPKMDVNETNDRYAMVEFDAKEDSVMHGIAGYFESVLFKDVLMSIHPDTHSEGMFSWFPIYFPIREPIQIRKGDKIKAHFWRCSNKHNVWYEWSLSTPVSTPVHNINGRSYTIGL